MATAGVGEGLAMAEVGRPGDAAGGGDGLYARDERRAGEEARREEDETKGLLEEAVPPPPLCVGGEQHWMPWTAFTCWMRLQAEVSWAAQRAQVKNGGSEKGGEVNYICMYP